MVNRSKRHHHTAQAYLKCFADRDDRLMVYDRITQRTALVHISKVAVETDLYTIDDADGNPSDVFERELFQGVDSAIAPIQKKLLGERPLLTTGDRANINAFLVLQHGRTPYMRDTLENIHDLMMRSEVEPQVRGRSPEEVEQFIKRFDPHASDQEKANIRQMAVDPSQPIRMDRAHWIRNLCRMVQRLAPALDSREWVLADAQDAAFLTGDLPVLIGGLHPLAIGDAPYICWPLSPSRMLMLGPPGSHNGRSFRGVAVSGDLVRDLNQLAADQAARQIFWHPVTDPMTEIVRPVGPHLSTVNGITVEPGERYYDKICDLLQAESAGSPAAEPEPPRSLRQWRRLRGVQSRRGSR
jgi:hypothetical protein